MISRLHILVLTLTFTDLRFVNGALFPKKSNVKHIDAQGFRDALKEESAFMAAFVAPWCGHCQKLVPEITRAADGLHPLVPVYAVDCDDNKNKPLCAEQGVKGFPTIKFYPGGKKAAALEFDGTRTASSLFYWASAAVPSKIQRSQNAKGVADIVRKNPGKPKAILINKSNKTPLLWKVLSNKYGDRIVFGNCRDRRGKVSVELGFEVGEKKHKILMYGADEKEPILYDGVMKFSVLSEYIEQILAGTVQLSRASYDAQQAVLKQPNNEEKLAEPEAAKEEEVDEIRIGDAGYGGFNPHEGVDMEELMKLSGGFNPHAAHGDGSKKAKASGQGSASPHKSGAPVSSDGEPSMAAPAESATTEAVTEHSKDEL